MPYFPLFELLCLYLACGLALAGYSALRQGADALPPVGWLLVVLRWPYLYGRGLWASRLRPRALDLEVRLLSRVVRWAVVRLEVVHGCRVEVSRPRED